VRMSSRLTTIGVLAATGVLALAGPASAHVEVEADKNQAGATDVTLTFHGEAENDSGIKSERVVLPEGIAPSAVTLVKAPSGWKYTATADGFTVGGKTLASGQDAEWSVKVAKLPDGETRLSFKTLETYADGQVSRWIEIQQEGKDEPDNPAPLITLKPGPKPAATSSAPAAVPSSAAPTTAAPSLATTPPAVVAEPAANTDEGSSTWWIWVIVALVVVGGAGFLLMRRRNTPPTD
jgi:LPXTG-motif cell wall-anchored protein